MSQKKYYKYNYKNYLTQIKNHDNTSEPEDQLSNEYYKNQYNRGDSDKNQYTVYINYDIPK